MSLSIRLARGGAKKRPFYRIVVADSRAPRDGRYIEKLGIYNPVLPKDHAERVVIDAEKAKEWLSKGAQPTDRVERFLDAAGVLTRKARNNPNKGQPGQKARERAEEKEQKRLEAEQAARDAAEAEAAAAAEAAANAPAEDAPAEEAPAAEPAAEPAEDAPAAEPAADETAN